MNPDHTESSTASYWCYRCTRFVRLSCAHHQNHITCPHCDSGFVEEIQANPSSSPNHHPLSPFPSGEAMSLMFADEPQNPFNSRRQGFRRRRRNGSIRSPFNPVIVLRGAADDDGGDQERSSSSFELYYDDGDGSGLRPLPPTVSEFLLGSGFDRLLEQFSEMEANGLGRSENLPASKTAIESMPTIEIVEDHVSTDTHCAICKEAFELGSKAREMPCKHIYHSDCIVPWLSMRNSCPVCRDELPSDRSPMESRVSGQVDEETVGLTIWRLPGGGFAVGRFPGGRGGVAAAESHLPVVYTEMDGGVNTSNNGAPRRISQAMGSIRVRESRGLGRIFRNFLSFFGRLGSRTSHSSIAVSAFLNSQFAPSCSDKMLIDNFFFV
ncbi:E3 ubiquitin-protein ligase RDUF2-like [Senna tora]|uniref:RING-type E3 ubiquitin transferase n=1 Tax=Senna tora TaxID=362788 RepID=A0A834TMI6_9FABA|nr:E3 ubiquitin-protein ligase RDUF2-like [Senna tora]